MNETFIHGEFLVIHNTGVLIRGPAGTGKSSLALELIERGHKLIADDLTVFRLRDDHIVGCSPAKHNHFLAIRDLGILDIRALFGQKATRQHHPLQLVIDLVSDIKAGTPRINTIHGNVNIMNTDIPLIEILVARQRNLAVFVETAIKNYILYNNGMDSNQEFINNLFLSN